MSENMQTFSTVRSISSLTEPRENTVSVRQALIRSGVSFGTIETLHSSLPFSSDDVTAGSENELQAVVEGQRQDVDLPLVIEQSNYFANILKRAAAGETPKKVVADLERFLSENSSNVWENSWVRFPRRFLSHYAGNVLESDMLADKKNPSLGKREDIGRFLFRDENGEEMLRIPISYLIKLALADLIGSQELLPQAIRSTGIRLLDHYLNDNTSPETFSFNVVSLTKEAGMGRAIARETAIRFLTTQLLVMYANRAFGLRENGQRAMVYFAPHPPVRQKELNDHISDSFYRELFMSPCLSGWDKGEAKFRYMQLCHQVLSRSQLNAVSKLRESGIIQNNLVVLPNLSNVSLANNGTHISIGSRRLTAAISDAGSGFTETDEKLLGDLAIKITEHFLPLFVGTYSAAPYRLAFNDFHPEKALGFLPHELDYTHLRMLWRRWKKKANLSILGQPVTPFGPEPLDRFVSSMFGLKGDYVPDYRLVDYLVCLLSTERSPALNGVIGNTDRLRRDLSEMGVFDEQMSVYLLYKQREFKKMGFSGFEGRHYSLFERFGEDMGRAADLQTLITLLAFKYMAYATITPANIPDTPSAESERRQIFFGSAIGIPTFFVRKDTKNSLLEKILSKTAGIRPSQRYPGYLRVQNHEYRKALLELLREDASDLIEMMGLQQTMDDLHERLEHPEQHSVAGRLERSILGGTKTSDPMKMDAREFNVTADQHYRVELRQTHLKESIEFLAETCSRMDNEISDLDDEDRRAFRSILQDQDASSFITKAGQEIISEDLDITTLKRLVNLILLTVRIDSKAGESSKATKRSDEKYATPIHRAG